MARNTLAAAVAGILLAVCAWTTLKAQTPRPARSVRDGIYSLEQALRGEALYEKHCDRCHGEDLGGDEGPALNSAEFLEDWKGMTAADIFERIRVWMPGDRPGILTREETAALLALILRSNRFPAGALDLPADKLTLSQFRVERPR